MNPLDALLAELDDDQKTAVMHGEGPLLVVAGAGSGKTRVLTYRVAALLARGLAQPHEILAVTFTNKAAREMAERVESLVGGSLRGGFVGTFHRFALQLLRNHPREAGLPERFAIADEDEQRQIVDRVLKRLDIPATRLSPRAARSRISAAKNALLSPKELENRARGDAERLIAQVYASYQAEVRDAGAVDFDDMLLEAVSLLERHDALRKSLASRFRWLLVDEYQDTNLAQARLVRLLGGKTPNLTAVGDEDQSIYRWRGAEVENILSFETAYPAASVVTLGRNYRSAEPILRAAAAVIERNTRRRPKRLTSQVGKGVPVGVYLAADEADEARFVADEIARLRGEVSAGEIAVLFRVNAQSRPFEGEMVRRAMPYVVVGGTRFWERKEVRDALSYLRLVVAPDDILAFRRAIHVPARGIGQVAMDRLAAAATAWAVPLPEAARRLPEELTPRARLALEAFSALLDRLRITARAAPAAEVVRELLDRSGLAAQYATDDEEDRARRANLDQLSAAAAEAGERGLDLAGFLDEVALLTDADVRREGDAVQLSTLHAAKGLEFDVVFLVGMEDGLLPLRREGSDDADEEEERRLAYVGMTRARRRLVLTLARVRRVNGQLLSGRPSPYLLDVPRDLVEDRTPAFGRDAFRAHAPHPHGHAARSVHASGEDASGVRTPERGPRPSPKHPDGWRPGLKVRHATFGSGVILQVQGTGAQTRLVVFFDRAGRKTLIPSLAKLEKA
ncbi:MAG TPA: UvrD-helicase domain-containing protein [Thermoanaerobaculaceae bacterium]|nr:UvrD-helicase domain-containing protein [Thermoanaerobaculaceae bacterium]